jgi:hypothetical protein
MAKRSSGGISAVSVGELRREIARRERRVGGLVRKRERLLDKARHIETQISELGGLVRGRPGAIPGRRRPSNESNLVESLSKVLTDKVMSVTDVTEAVQKAGYTTTSPNFRTIVNQALIASGKFKRVGRGQYTAK